MGIIVTPNQGLIAPDKDDFVHNYPLYNELNMDKIDEYIGSPLFNSYIPILQQRGGESGFPNPNLGSTGTIEGDWFRVFNWVYVVGHFEFAGTGINPGAENTGFYTVTLPVAASGEIDAVYTTAESTVIGKATCRDASATLKTETLVCQLADHNRVMFIIEGGEVSARAVRFDEPFTWADQDRLTFVVYYPIAL